MSKKKKKKYDNNLVKNKKAFHNYEILESYEAGIELKGTEVKSCRVCNISMGESYAKIINNEVFLINTHIAIYDHGNQFNHNPTRDRRLLLHKNEIRKLLFNTREKAHTLVPLNFYIKNGKIKVAIGVAKGKTQGDKRHTLRQKQDDMDAKRAIARNS